MKNRNYFNLMSIPKIEENCKYHNEYIKSGIEKYNNPCDYMRSEIEKYNNRCEKFEAELELLQKNLERIKLIVAQNLKLDTNSLKKH